MSNTRLTTEAAWSVVLARRHALHDAGPDHGPTAATVIEPDGSWRSSLEPTPEARQLLDLLAPLVAGPAPLAMGQLGQSLDGRIATESGHSHYINGLETRAHLHRLRALVDAVVVGAGTAVADDPRLTVRHVTGPQPVRVILDPRARVPPELGLLANPEAPTVHVVGAQAMMPDRYGDHVRHLRLTPDPDGGFSPSRVLEALTAEGFRRVLIEGGGVTVSRFLEAGALRRLHLMVGPLVIGSGRPGLNTTPVESLRDALRPRVRRFDCGGDTLFDLALP